MTDISEVLFSLTCCKHITTFKSSAFLQHSPQHFRGTTRRGMYNLSHCQISIYCLLVGICMCKLLSTGFSLSELFFLVYYRSLKMLVQLNLLRSNCLHPKVSCATLDLNKCLQCMIHVQCILCVGTLLWNTFQLFYWRQPLCYMHTHLTITFRAKKNRKEWTRSSLINLELFNP